MKNTKMIFAGLLLAIATGVSAQSVSYKKIYCDPDDYKRSVLYLDLFSADYYLGATLGSGLKVETVIADRIMPWARLNFAIADMNTHHVVSGYPTSAGGLKKQQILDIGSAFFLMSKNVTRKVKISLSSYKSGNTTHSKYMMIPAEVKKMLGLEGGINLNRKAMVFEDESHEFFRYKSADGTINTPIESVGNSGSNQPAGEYYQPVSMAHIFSFYGGIHTRKVRNMCVSIDGWGMKTNSTISDFYADVMLAPVVTIANVIDVAGKEWILSPQAGAIKHLGWRAGFTHHSTEHTCSFAYNCEFGQKPGPVMGKSILNSGAYISMGMGMSIGSDKHIGTHKKSNPASDAPDAPEKS